MDTCLSGVSASNYREFASEPGGGRCVLLYRARVIPLRSSLCESSGVFMARPAGKIKSVAFVSLGCPKNLVDSERMLGLLAQDGLTMTSDAARADAIVINTCGFLEASKQESLQAIREAIDQKKNGQCKRVVVAGCLVQRHKTKLLSEVPEVDRLVGVFDREHIVEAVHGKENPRQEHGHFLGKDHELSLKEGTTEGAGTKARPALTRGEG